ncbi:MAG: hypothetical protein CSYNP_04166 [Syntrophus sp. SKADARSKE-3]|nr:hypothetical protein [Syntrophus sp. SKADARSKE-3]
MSFLILCYKSRKGKNHQLSKLNMEQRLEKTIEKNVNDEITHINLPSVIIVYSALQDHLDGDETICCLLRSTDWICGQAVRS